MEWLAGNVFAVDRKIWFLKQKVGDAAPPLPPGAGGEFAPWNSSQAWQRYGSKRPSKSAANKNADFTCKRRLKLMACELGPRLGSNPKSNPDP